MNPDPKPLLTTLPGDISGLLRRGSPVIWDTADLPGRPVCFERGVIDEIAGDRIVHTMPGGGGPWHSPRRIVEGAPGEVALDLTDATGRAHAAWWVRAHAAQMELSSAEQGVFHSITLGFNLTPEQIDALARLILRLAGRTL